ncbi:MAG: GldM family protein [Saprospiraceae bacterium]
MSIPKEPRQLMINVMYLVLTALLALNVSAEIFNAFEMVDKGLIKANDALDAGNKDLPGSIKDSAKKSANFDKYAQRVDVVGQISKEGSEYIKVILDKVVDEAGDMNGIHDDGDYITTDGIKELKGKRDYAATTRLLVDKKEGEKLKTKMLELKDKYLNLIDEADRKEFANKIAINIDEETWKKSTNKKENWADFTFGHMPLGACMPIFSKFNNDVKSSEAAVLNYLAGKVGLTSEVVLNKFRVVSAPKKSYIINGEQFETEVFLSASADQNSNTGIRISVNGANLPLNPEGAAKWTQKANGIGVKKYEAVASVTNPVTGKTDTYRQTFEFEVGERSVTISAAKMNVFYLGVDNPVEVSAAGVPSAQIKVSMSGGDINRNGDGTYTVRPTGSPGTEAVVSVSAPGLNGSKKFKIKRIPDPKPLLGGKENGGKIGNGTFKGYSSLIPLLENFDFDAKCNLGGFTLVRVPKRLDAEFAPNRGARIDGQAAALQSKAVPGDRYIFQDIKCKCPGDVADRNLGQLVFDIQ